MKNLAVIRFVFIFATLLIANGTALFCQEFFQELTQKIEKPRAARLMFYNCENLFDYIDDTLKNDEEFLPEGDRYWSKGKYYDKLNHISKVITAIGGWSPPEIVGLCEIENAKTLYDLTHNSPLYLYEYKIIHQESPDDRGIDVALLYQSKNYTPIQNRFIAIHFPDNLEKHTRDILYSKGILNNADTIHLFVNHWPSRWGGELESEEYRLIVASVLKKQTDSIFIYDAAPNIIIMGDFNDEPANRSIAEILDAKSKSAEYDESKLYNLTTLTGITQTIGSHKYKGNWSLFDQFILSGNLLSPNNNLFTLAEDFTIFNAPFLLEKDETYLGVKPFRTFVGYKYNGGYSDHLPIFFDLNK